MKRKNKPQLNTEDAIHVQGVVESEGSMDYAFRYYSGFKEIKDKKFHSLRKAYVKAAQELSDYARLEEEFEQPDDSAADEFDPAQGIDGPEDYQCHKCGDELADDGTCHTCNHGGGE
jgi:hypothetical protein